MVSACAQTAASCWQPARPAVSPTSALARVRPLASVGATCPRHGVRQVSRTSRCISRPTPTCGVPQRCRASSKGALGTGVAQRFLKAQIDRRLPPGPTAEQRANGRAVVVAEAWNAAGKSVVSRLVTPEPYALTALTAVEIVCRAANREAVAGFMTPSAVFGADFIMRFESVQRIDF